MSAGTAGRGLRVALLPGDGVGPEVTAEARKVLEAVGVDIVWTELPWGSSYWHEHGTMMPADAIETLGAHDAVLMGAVGILRCLIPRRSGG